MTTPSTVTHVPRVWIGCMNCYSNARLVGDWFDCTDAEDVDLDAVHKHAPHAMTDSCEELWCFDADNVPETVEIDPQRAALWGEAFETIGEHLWPAFSAWAQSGSQVEDGDGLPDTGEFEDRFAGEWGSFREFADNYVEEAGILHGASEVQERYFNWESHATDLKNDFTVVDAPGSGVFVFRDF